MKLKFLLILAEFFVLTASAQFGPGTNNLWSVSNNLTHFKYDGRQFTNTVDFTSLSTNTAWFKLHINDDTNEYYYVLATNNNAYILQSNSTASAHIILAISNDISGNMSLWSEAGIELGKTPDLGFAARRWRVHGIDSLFDGATYGFFSPTNISTTAVNISGNVAATETFFSSPQVTQAGMYEVSATLIVTQACVGATMRIGVITEDPNLSGISPNYYITNWIMNNAPLTSITNYSGSVVCNNGFSKPIGYTTPVTGFSSGTALGQIYWFIRQIQ